MIRHTLVEAAQDPVTPRELEILQKFVKKINTEDRLRSSSYTMYSALIFAIASVFLYFLVISRSHGIVDMSMLCVFGFMAVAALTCIYFLSKDADDRINISIDKVSTYPYRFTFIRKQADNDISNVDKQNYVFKVSGDLGSYVMIDTMEKGFFYDTLERDKRYIMYVVNDKFVIFVKLKRKKVEGE